MDSKVSSPIKKDYGFVAIATCTGKDGKKWYITEKQQFIREDFIDLSTASELPKLDNGKLVGKIKIKVKQTKSDKVWMKEKPYTAAAKMVPVNKGDILQVVAVYSDNATPAPHYWLQFDNDYFLCANNVEFVTCNDEIFSLSKYDGPTDGKNYDAAGNSIHLAGTI